MRVIIAGSRGITDLATVAKAYRASGFEATEIVSGMASGVDRLGETFAKSEGIPIKQFPANWSLGKKAGYLRNVEMANYADALVAVWDGKSRGTKHMIDIATAKNLKVSLTLTVTDPPTDPKT